SKLPGHIAIGEPHTPSHQQRKGPQDQEVHPEKPVAHGLDRSAAEFDPKDQSRKDAFEPTLDFRHAAVPADRGGQRTAFFGGAYHDRWLWTRSVFRVLVRQDGVK